MKVIQCCRNCEKRKPHCHVDCAEYLLQKKEAKVPFDENGRQYYEYIRENTEMRKKKMNLGGKR